MSERAVTRWGILSTARINDKLIAGARASDAVEMVAVASRDFARAQDYARRNGFERAYGSYEELLADPDLDAVYISLPNSLHVEWATRALQAGKHVLCEKPLSRRAAEVETLFDTAVETGRICMEAFMWRHNPQAKRLATLVAEGAVGEPRLIRAAFSFSLADTGDVRMLAELDGGALMDVGCYCVSAVRLLAGEPVSVTAQRISGPTGIDTRFLGTMAFDAGVLAEIDAAFDLPVRSELEAIGSEGSIVVSDPWHCRTPGLELRRGEAVEAIAIEPVNSYRLQLENVGAAIRGEAEPLLGRADAVGQARAIEALYRAAESGRTERLR
jgi:D-xylose 1-dehydrogenase (NADP+, D-xylono-1,5-lactone-forming)